MGQDLKVPSWAVSFVFSNAAIKSSLPKMSPPNLDDYFTLAFKYLSRQKLFVVFQGAAKCLFCSNKHVIGILVLFDLKKIHRYRIRENI